MMNEPQRTSAGRLPYKNLLDFAWLNLRVVIFLGIKHGSLRASSPFWASETSLARMREARFSCPKRRACLQAINMVAYFCQQVRKPLGSCTRVFTLYGGKNIAINSA